VILQRHPSRVSRRTAFTLLEVLVVVAIILVLASVATVATMSYLEDAKESKTRINLKTVEKTAQGIITTHPSGENIDPSELRALVVRKLSNGETDMLDGWGGPIQVQIQQDQNGNAKAQATAEHNGVTYSSWDVQ
jgi:general secretion pathway protein G